jgi:hypothetical protein
MRKRSARGSSLLHMRPGSNPSKHRGRFKQMVRLKRAVRLVWELRRKSRRSKWIIFDFEL